MTESETQPLSSGILQLSSNLQVREPRSVTGAADQVPGDSESGVNPYTVSGTETHYVKARTASPTETLFGIHDK
ncbi:hypothetical protein ElyMa_000631500 [Elysia marginata]|uniref:Uncharacterized protein n=1 Tax=Elysia marginata TaxID=1093978 RepID=A0AAV4GC62_9GAST|nr:hypothetical protein ElyMa_000631500 [Elysia marginata]